MDLRYKKSRPAVTSKFHRHIKMNNNNLHTYYYD